VEKFDTVSADEKEGEPLNTSGNGAREPTGFQMFCFSRYYHYLSIVQISPFTASPSHSVAESHSLQFSARIFSLSALPEGAGGGGEKIYRGPNTLSVALSRARQTIDNTAHAL
jgi:hypothetical protein